MGGILTTTVLANLDILNHQRPLNALNLARGDVRELALVYHRLIELNKIGAKQVSLLGDPYNPTTGACLSFNISIGETFLVLRIDVRLILAPMTFPQSQFLVTLTFPWCNLTPCLCDIFEFHP